MNYIHSLFQKLGPWGMGVSYLLSLVFIILLYLGIVAENQLEQSERGILAIVLFLAITYTYAKHFYASCKLDESQFYAYPITTLSKVKDNIQSQGVKSIYIGTPSKAKNISGWENLSKQYYYAKSIKTAYDPSINKNRQSIKWFGCEKIFGITYKSGLTQFVQIKPLSNDLFETIEFIKPLTKSGIQVQGEFEKLEKAQPQFTIKRWTKIIVIIFVVTISLILISVFIAGWKDSLK